MPAVEPSVLKWARETAGLSIETAVDRLDLNDAYGISAVSRLEQIETGKTVPNRSLLLRMAKVYKRPLVALYLSSPPRKGDRGQDYRTLPNRSTEDEFLVDALVRDIRARQSMVRDVLADSEDYEPLRFVGSVRIDDGVNSALTAIRDVIDIDVLSFRSQGTPEAAFGLLRSSIEACGIFVLLAGNLGSHHTALEVSAFRGFAIADAIAPFIVINDQDAKTAWSFTLLHELAHIFLGNTGISGGLSSNRVEQFCNDVASNFLLPSIELSMLDLSEGTSLSDATLIISRFAQDRMLSRSMVAYRLFRARRLSEDSWRALVDLFASEWREERAVRRNNERTRGGGPNYYVVRRHRVGSALLNFVAQGLNEGALTPTKAGKILGVKARQIKPLLSTVVATGTVV